MALNPCNFPLPAIPSIDIPLPPSIVDILKLLLEYLDFLKSLLPIEFPPCVL